MSETESYESAWQAYQQAVNELYTPPGALEVARSAEFYAEHLEQRSNTALERSEQVRTALAATLETGDLAQRELAALRLLSAAAYDLSVASDLLEVEESGTVVGLDRSARGILLAEDDLLLVLDAPPEAGVLDLVAIERVVLPLDPAGARTALEKTIASFLQDVPKDTADLTQKALSGVLLLGLAPLQGAASVAVQEILAHVPEGVSLAVRNAARVIVEAIMKLRTATGEQQGEQVCEEALNWLKDLQEKRDTVASLLDKLYQTEAIAGETNRVLQGAPVGTEAERYNQATEHLRELSARYAKVKKVLSAIMSVLAFAKTPLMGAVPWGPIAVYATYAGILGYAVYSGGDYLDWYRVDRVEWLERVEGLRTTVHQALEAAP